MGLIFGRKKHRKRAAYDPDEFVDVVWVPVDEVVAAVRAGIIQDAKTVISALFAASLA